MVLLNICALAGLSSALHTLADRQRAAFVEVVFCYRVGVLSTTALFNDAEVLSEVAGHIPDKISQTNTRRYSLDMESLAIGEPRFMLMATSGVCCYLGFTYLVMGALAEWKR